MQNECNDVALHPGGTQSPYRRGDEAPADAAPVYTTHRLVGVFSIMRIRRIRTLPVATHTHPNPPPNQPTRNTHIHTFSIRLVRRGCWLAYDCVWRRGLMFRCSTTQRAHHRLPADGRRLAYGTFNGPPTPTPSAHCIVSLLGCCCCCCSTSHQCLVTMVIPMHCVHSHRVFVGFWDARTDLSLCWLCFRCFYCLLSVENSYKNTYIYTRIHAAWYSL